LPAESASKNGENVAALSVERNQLFAVPDGAVMNIIAVAENVWAAIARPARPSVPGLVVKPSEPSAATELRATPFAVVHT